MAYAEVSDVEARWRDLTTDEAAKAAVLLDDASAVLTRFVDVDTSDAGQAELLKIVCCDMVIRSMVSTSSETYGMSASSMTAGPYSQSWTYSNPSGDLYITRLEKRLLGISSGYIGAVPAAIDGDYGSNDG